MAEVNSTGQMAPSMRAIGTITLPMVKVDSSMPMETPMYTGS